MGEGLGDIAKMQNDITASGLAGADAVDKSRKANESQAVTTDQVTQGFTEATHAVTDFQVKTETLATTLMPQYATAIKNATETVTQAAQDAMDIASGKKTLSQVAKEHGIKGAEGSPGTNVQKGPGVGPGGSGFSVPNTPSNRMFYGSLVPDKTGKWLVRPTKQQEQLGDDKNRRERIKQKLAEDAKLNPLAPEKMSKTKVAELEKQLQDLETKIKQDEADIKKSDSAATPTPGNKASTIGNKTVAITDKDGREVEKRVGGDRNWRNNNPGNIIYGDFAIRHGAIGSDGQFAIFPDEEMGRKAQDALLKSKNYQDKTIGQAIAQWDSVEQAAYKQAMKSAGIDLDKKYADLDSKQQGQFLDAQKRIEGGKAGEVIRTTPQFEQPVQPATQLAQNTSQPKKLSADDQRKADALNAQNAQALNDLDDRTKYDALGNPITKHAKGGKIGAGRIGLVGEQGPELIQGPAEITTNKVTEQLVESLKTLNKLTAAQINEKSHTVISEAGKDPTDEVKIKMIAALDALREMSGERTGINDFKAQIGMNEDRWKVLEDRIKPVQQPGQNLEDLRKQLETKMKELNDKDPAMQKAMEYMMRDEGPDDTTKQLASTMQSHTEILNRIAESMNKNNNLTSGILQNSY